MSALLDRIFVARAEWAEQHGGRWPVAVHLSPKATIRALRATCGLAAVAPVLVAHGEDRQGQMWTVKRWAHDVLQMDWFEDTRLKDESFEFKAVVESAHP